MATADGLVLLTGGVAFAGSFAEEGGFPSNGYAILGSTAALTFLASLSNGTPISPAVKGLAGLMLLGAVYRYVPAFTKTKSSRKRKVKSHG